MSLGILVSNKRDQVRVEVGLYVACMVCVDGRRCVACDGRLYANDVMIKERVRLRLTCKNELVGLGARCTIEHAVWRCIGCVGRFRRVCIAKRCEGVAE